MAEPTLPLTGGCLCGGVRFQLDRAPDSANYCHCTRCQRRTGTGASAQARIDPDALRIVQGADLIGEWKPPGGFAKLFCTSCGAALFSRPPDDPRPRSVRMAAFDTDPGVRPRFRQYVAYAASWEPIPDDGLPRYAEGYSPAGNL
jgi:hypothetical protein